MSVVQRPHRRHQADVGGRGTAHIDRRREVGGGTDQLHRASTSSTAARRSCGRRPDPDASSSAARQSTTYAGDRVRSRSAQRGQVALDRRRVAADGRSGERLGRAQPLHVVQARALQREHRAQRIGHTRTPEQILGDPARHDEVVRGEDGGRVIQRPHRVVQPERPGHEVVGDALPDRVALVVLGGDGHGAPGDAFEGAGDVGERLQRMERERPGTGRSRGREDVEARCPRQVGHPLPGTEPSRSGDPFRDRGDVVVGNADEDELAGARRVRGIEERHVGEEPRRAVAGGTAARDRDDPMSGAAEEDRHRGPHASRADDRDVHRSEYAKSDRSAGQRIQTIGPSGAGASAGGCSRTRSPPIRREQALSRLDEDGVVERERPVRDPRHRADVPRRRPRRPRTRCRGGRTPAERLASHDEGQGGVRVPRQHPRDRERLVRDAVRQWPRLTRARGNAEPHPRDRRVPGRAVWGAASSVASDSCGTTMMSDSVEIATIA